MKAYRIADWKSRYEVTSKGKPAAVDTPDSELRKSPLPYLRFRVYGHKHGPAYRKLVRLAWAEGVMMEMAAFGLFAKLLELAADQEAPFRGWILDEKQRSMTAEKVAETLDIHDAKYVQKLLNILCDPDVGWVELAEFPDFPRLSSTDGGKRGKLVDKIPRPMGEASEGFFKNENETEGKLNLNERKANPLEKGNISVSDLKIPFSVSDSAAAARQKTAWRLAEILRPANKSDSTTLADILDQLKDGVSEGRFTIEIFDVVIKTAAECTTANRPIAMFVEAMKQPRFGYMPRRRSLLGRVFR